MFQMKCQVTSSITRRVMISREDEVARFKDICGGEKRRVNFGYFQYPNILEVEDNKLVEFMSIDKIELSDAYDWEILKIFFSIHNIEPIWLDCNWSWGWYDAEQGAWTGCMGKVR